MKINSQSGLPSVRTVPALRLVNAQGVPVATTLRASHAEESEQTPDGRLAASLSAERRARHVAAENQEAAGLSALDPRWIFAVQVSKSLDGGRAAILSPERRQRLLGDAARLGLRLFDANLVIAVVQDGARTGEGALSHGAESRLRLVRPVHRPPVVSASAAALMVSGTTVALAIGIFMLALSWIKG